MKLVMPGPYLARRRLPFVSVFTENVGKQHAELEGVKV
jgi:hypothetical protein